MQCLHNECARLIVGTACFGTRRAARIRGAVTRARARVALHSEDEQRSPPPGLRILDQCGSTDAAAPCCAKSPAS